MSDHLEEQLFCLRELVLAAGGLQLDCLGRIKQVESKGATEFVTDVDRRVEELMLAGLAAVGALASRRKAA